jgi:hypothetical protein
MGRTSFLVAVCLSLCGALSAATSFTLYGTGFTSGGAQVAAGSGDGNWILVSDPTVGDGCDTPCVALNVGNNFIPLVTDGSDTSFPFPNWLSDSSTSEWISPRASETTDSDPWSATVPYIYTETFTIPATLNASTAVIAGQWSADNYGNIFVNGNQVTAGVDGAIPNNTGEFATFTAFTLDGSATGTENAPSLHTGSNTLTFEVFNNNAGTPDVTGLNVQIISATANAAPEPASFGFLGFGLAVLGILGRRLRS